MFTGLVEAKGKVLGSSASRDGLRLEVGTPWAVRAGESISVGGVCLTAVDDGRRSVEFDVVPETLRLTTIGSLKRGDAVNLERALKAGARFGGHVVQGHVDGVGKVASFRRSGKGTVLRVAAKGLTGRMASKGSIAVDGVSLTLVEVTRDAFTVALIPTTLRITTLGALRAGAKVNLELDHAVAPAAGGVTRELLRRAGFTSR